MVNWLYHNKDGVPEWDGHFDETFNEDSLINGGVSSFNNKEEVHWKRNDLGPCFVLVEGFWSRVILCRLGSCISLIPY